MMDPLESFDRIVEAGRGKCGKCNFRSGLYRLTTGQEHLAICGDCMTQWLMEWNAAITLDVEEDERVPHPSGEPDAEDIPIGNVTQMQRKAIHEQVSRGLDVALRHEDLDNESRLSILSTFNTAVENHLDSFDEQAGNLPTVEAFAEIELDPEGISMSLYRESDTEHGRVDLVDENWRTWGELSPGAKIPPVEDSHTFDLGTR